MTKALALYLCALSLHVILLSVVFQFQIHKRQPVFALLLLESLGANVTLLLLARANEREAYRLAVARLDLLWCALAVGAIIWAIVGAVHEPPVQGVRIQDAASGPIISGLLAMLAMTIIIRYGADAPFVGGLGARVASAANAAYLAPTVYLIFALSNVSIDRLMLWVGAIHESPLQAALEAAAGYARSFLA